MDLNSYLELETSFAVALASVIGVAPSNVSQWKTGRRPIPSDRCPSIERATNGMVTCEEMRPDVDWGYLRGTKPVCSDSPVKDGICANPGLPIDKAD